MKEIQVVEYNAIIGSIRVVNDHPTNGLYIPVDVYGQTLGQRRSKDSAHDVVVYEWINTLNALWLIQTAAAKMENDND